MEFSYLVLLVVWFDLTVLKKLAVISVLRLRSEVKTKPIGWWSKSVWWKTKIDEFHIRFVKKKTKIETEIFTIMYTSSDSSPNSFSSVRTIRLNMSIWKDRNSKNPRQIFRFSKSIIRQPFCVQIWAPNSFWRLRYLSSKFKTDFDCCSELSFSKSRHEPNFQVEHRDFFSGSSNF